MADGSGTSSGKKPVASFFSGILGIAGYLGGGWYPSGSREGAAPFRQVSSDSGVTITPGSSLQLTAVFACVNLITSIFSTLPVLLSARDINGVLQPMTNSPIYRMLALSPNKDMTAVDFWTMMVSSLCMWGNAYALKGTIAGRTVSLEPLRPEFMTVFRDMNGDILYAYSRIHSQGPEIYTADQILHIKAFGVDGLIGMSPIAMARQSLGRALSTDSASGSMFLNGLTSGGFIQYAQVLKKEQRDEVRKNLTSFTGSSNAGKVMVLEGGMTYTPITMNAKDAQMLESRAWNFEDICHWFMVPPPLVGHTSKSSSWASSFENTILWFIKSCLRTYVVRVEQAVSKSLGLAANVVLEFNMDDLERGDSAARSALYASAAQNGWMSRNEIRTLENYPRDTSPGSDRLTVQSNLIPLDRIDELGGAQGTSTAGDSTGGNSGKTP